MKKIAIILGAFVFVLASCQNKAKNQENVENTEVEAVVEETPADASEAFLGSWVEANPANAEEVQGIALKSDSLAESINNATVANTKWWVDDSNLYLIQEKQGAEITTDTITFEVEAISADSLILRDGEMTISYKKQN